jgi:DNA-binding NtrC family response regulator
VPRRVLIVEDDDDLRRSLERVLLKDGCDVTPARDGQEAIDKLAAGLTVDLVITDLEMPRAGGREVLEAATARGFPVVILTAHSSVTVAVDLMRRGAANFLTKPFSPSSIRAVLEDSFGRAAPPKKRTDAPAVVGTDPAFGRVLNTIDSVAETDATVLLLGESGTGKEVMARAIHQASRRAAGPFVAVNCGAIPEALLESELFGHAKGAFTGATQSRAGRFQLADAGTLFLDEIGDMPLHFQVKILRAIQERQVEVLGEGVARPIDVRIIAATHRDLPRMVSDGTFREDLYYRINVIELHLPPLRERKGDIPLLVDHFRQAANARHGRTVSGFSPEALAALAAHNWPGNIRELANLVERVVILTKTGVVQADQMPLRGAPPAPATPPGRAALPATGIDLRQAVAEYEETLIDQALERTGGNRNAAAQLLGLNRTTLVEKLKRRTE